MFPHRIAREAPNPGNPEFAGPKSYGHACRVNRPNLGVHTHVPVGMKKTPDQRMFGRCPATRVAIVYDEFDVSEPALLENPPDVFDSLIRIFSRLKAHVDHRLGLGAHRREGVLQHGLLPLLGLALGVGLAVASLMPLRGRKLARTPLATWGMATAHFGIAVALIALIPLATSTPDEQGAGDRLRAPRGRGAGRPPA